VFGPLPRLHRLLVVATALIVGVLSGIWIFTVTEVPTLVAAGLGWGLLTGLLLIYVLLHDFHHQQRPVRVRRH
jgi:hypothetical protein